MRWFILFSAAAWSGLFCVGPAFAQAPRNVVLVIADDMGLDMPSYGNDVIKTPHLENLAKKGILFTQAYATVASCSASRASILTGTYTHQNGQFGHAHLPHSQTVHPWIESLPLWLNRVGYYTGLIGKYHVAPDSAFPFRELITRGLKGNRGPKEMAAAARKFLTNANKKPFFLVYSSSDPHRAGKGFGNERFAGEAGEVKYNPRNVIVPFFLPDEPEVRQEIAEYYQAVTRFDRNVGALVEVLRDMGHLDNTIIIVISDNGIPFPGAKTNIYDPGVHLPLIIASPDHKKGHTNQAMVSYVDLAPTIVDIAGAKGPKKYKLPGRSLLPILNQSDPKGWDTIYCSHQFHEITMYYPMRALKNRKYKYIVNLAHKLDYPFASDLYASPTWQGILKRDAVMMGKRTVKAYLHRPLEELYDVTEDPYEVKNLAANPAYAEALAKLRRQMTAWQNRTDDPWTILYRQGLNLGEN